MELHDKKSDQLITELNQLRQEVNEFQHVRQQFAQLEKNLNECKNNLSVLVNVNKQFAATLDLDVLLQTTTNEIVALTGLDSAAVYLLEDEDLLLKATNPPLPPDFPDVYRRAPLQEHPHINEVVTTGKIVSIADTLETELTPAEEEIVAGRNLRSILYLPIQFREIMAGTLIVASCDEPRQISTDIIELCEILIHQAALVLENAQYHRQVQQYADNLETLVEERTERLNFLVKAMTGREVRMAELKKVIEKLRTQIEQAGMTPVANDPLIEGLPPK